MVQAILYQIRAFSTQGSDSLMSACARVYREEGLASFWRGNFTSCVHRFPYSAINFTVYSALHGFVNDSLDVEERPSSRLVCGAVAGATACIACYPLDLVRTRLTVQSSDYYRGIMHCLSRIVQEEGPLGLYKGLGMSLFVSVPSLAISFSVYGTIKHSLVSADRPFASLVTGTAQHKSLSTYGSCLAGAASGITASLILFPADVIRRRMQVRTEGRNRRVLKEFLRIIRNEGFRGLYRGILPEVLKVSPMVGIQFTVYENIIRLLGGLSRP